MEQPTTISDTVAVLDPAVLETSGGRSDKPTWLQRARQSRAGAALRSFPSRVFLLALAFYLTITCLHVWVLGTPGGQPAAPGSVPLADWGTGFTAAWRRFDSYFFLDIARHGYTVQGLGAFFPLYPLLIRLCAWPLAGHFTLAALLVSWLCAWGSYLWFYRLAAREFGEQVARWALLFLACCPVSFFSFAPYSESLFLLVSIGAVERARAGRLWQASALAALGMLTRPTGILLLLPLAWEWGRRSEKALRLVSQLRQISAHLRFRAAATAQHLSAGALLSVGAAQPLARFAWLGLGLVPLALLGYMLFLQWHNGNALAFLAGESAWHRHLTLPWDTVGLFATAFQRAGQTGAPELYAINILDLLLVIPLPLWVLYSAIRRKRLWLGAALYQLALTLMLIAVPTYPAQIPYEVLLSTERFMLPAFPIFLLLGQVGGRHPRLARLLLGVGLALLMFNTLRFLAGNFIA